MPSNGSNAHTLFVGVDIAATTATIAWTTAHGTHTRPMTIAQTPAGFLLLQQHLLRTGTAPADTLVVMEATGAYWMQLATFLVERDFAVSVINPKQAHYFAKALLKRAKTDAIDAQTLAQLAACLQPAIWTPPPALYHELQQRLTQRAALITMRQQARNQRHALVQQPYVVASVCERLDAMIALFTAQIADVDAEIATALRQDAAWEAATARLQTIPGVGVISTAWLLVATLNFTLCPRLRH